MENEETLRLRGRERTSREEVAEQKKSESSIAEAVSVVIKESQENRVRDVVLSLNTVDAMEATEVTKKINGFLEGILVSSVKPVFFSVVLDEIPDVVLYQFHNFMGTKFIPIRADTIDIDGKLLVNTQDKFALNNKLRILIKGPKQSSLNIVVRYSV